MSYWQEAFRWRRGRQGTGYDKMLLATWHWPLPFDCYLIRYPEGAAIPPHRDPVGEGRHYRANLILWSPKAGGEFLCEDAIHDGRRLKVFRPDVAEHSVTTVVGGSRWVLSIGWIKGLSR